MRIPFALLLLAGFMAGTIAVQAAETVNRHDGKGAELRMAAH